MRLYNREPMYSTRYAKKPDMAAITAGMFLASCFAYFGGHLVAYWMRAL